jgi:hypothetical protein
MDACVPAQLDGVDQTAARILLANLQIATTMAPLLIRTEVMAALAIATRVGEVQSAEQTSPAKLQRIAAAMAPLPTRTMPMVAFVNAPRVGVALHATPTSLAQLRRIAVATAQPLT